MAASARGKDQVNLLFLIGRVVKKNFKKVWKWTILGNGDTLIYSLYFILISWWMEVAGNIGGHQPWTG